MNEELPPLLKAAQDQGVSIFWFYLSSCLYERTEIANYQAAHNTSTPLDRLSKPGRQAVLSEACHKLIRLAETKKISQPAGLGTPTQTQGGNQEEQTLDCCLLMKYAVDYAVEAAGGGGPTTMLHRRLDLASKWVDEVKGLPSSDRVSLAGDLSDALAEVQKVIPWLIQEARWGLAKAGEVKDREDNEHFKSARDQAYYVRKNLIELLNALPDYEALEQGDRKWSVLGFRDREDLESYLFPTLERLSRSTDPMQWDLFERLSENPAFTPRELANEGYRTDLVMDTLNALLTKKWAEWTDLSVLGSDAKGRITPVGQRLLKQMVAQKSAAGQ